MNITELDVRTIDPVERHSIIFKTFDEIKLCDSFELVNDHDPQPLLYYFQTERPDEFSWDYIEKGPIWRVRIGRIAEPGPDGEEEGCCGMCRG